MKPWHQGVVAIPANKIVSGKRHPYAKPIMTVQFVRFK